MLNKSIIHGKIQCNKRTWIVVIREKTVIVDGKYSKRELCLCRFRYLDVAKDGTEQDPPAGFRSNSGQVALGSDEGEYSTCHVQQRVVGPARRVPRSGSTHHQN